MCASSGVYVPRDTHRWGADDHGIELDDQRVDLLHAVGGDRVRRRLGVGRGRGEARASQRVLDTRRERGGEVEVVVRVLAGGGEDLVHAGEDGRHPRGGRRRRGPEGQLVTTLLESAVRHEQMEVDVEPEVAAEALDDRNDAAVERRDRGEQPGACSRLGP